MQTHTLPVLAVIFGTILLLLGITSYVENRDTPDPESPTPQQEEPDTDTENDVLSYGLVRLSVGEKATFEDISITALRIAEESRCPGDAVCVQAGTVRVVVEIVSGLGTSTNTMALGDFVTTEAERIELIDAEPYPTTSGPIPATKRPAESINPPAPILGKCYIGGCSGQLCTDQPDAVSTCEYREEYACYQTATCERQPNGQCGWTPTAELQACLLGN
jgi:hypothetical protein